MERISDPPRAMPVSIDELRTVSQITSCMATMSGGIWMTGSPSQLHW